MTLHPIPLNFLIYEEIFFSFLSMNKTNIIQNMTKKIFYLFQLLAKTSCGQDFLLPIHILLTRVVLRCWRYQAICPGNFTLFFGEMKLLIKVEELQRKLKSL
jgi:hypothetical protein